jgi:PAS domain S-box-containing protein
MGKIKNNDHQPVTGGRPAEKVRIEHSLPEGEEKLRILLTHASMGIVVAQDGLLKFANPKMIRMSGYSLPELTARPFSGFLHPDDRSMVMAYHSKRLKGEKVPETYVIRLLTKTGGVKFIENSGTIIDWNGRTASLNFLIDITERKRTEEDLSQKETELRESEQKYRQLFENESDALMIFDAESLLFEEANQAALELYGYSKEEFLTLTVEDISAEKRETRASVQQVKNGQLIGNRVPLRYFKKKNGTIFPGEIATGKFISGGHQKIIGSVRDITERLRSEQQLRESEEFNTSLLNNTPNPILVVNADTSIKYVNQAFESLTRFSAIELIGKKAPYPWWLPETVSETHAQFSQALRDGLNRFEKCFQTKKGDPFWVEITSSPIKRKGETKFYLSTWIDVTARKFADKKLNESEERYRRLVDNIAIGVSLISPEMEILTLNKQMKKWYPHIDPTKKPICYQSFNDPPSMDICSYCPTIQTLRDGEVHEAITETPAGDEIRYYRIISSPITDPEGQVTAAIEMVEDISEKLMAESHIRDLSQQLLKAHEDERQVIARELHDSVAQDLSTLKIVFKTIFDGREGEPNQKSADGSKLFALIDRTIASVRNLSYDLRPPGLSELGLIRTLTTYCEEFAAENSLKVEFQSAGFKKITLDSLVEINVYRLVQEGLNNIRKHAQAHRVVVKLVGVSPNIVLRIEDDGKGFDMQRRERSIKEEKRLGLRSMKERVNLLQGEMSIDSHPGKGTKILIKFPFKRGLE